MSRFSTTLLLALILGGCSGRPRSRPNVTHVPDWVGEDARPVSAAIPAPVAPAAEAARPPETPVGLLPPPVRADSLNGTWISLPRWCSTLGLNPPTRVVGASAPAYALATTNGVLVLRPGSQVANWDGTEIRLGYPPQIIEGQPFIHALDLTKTIAPLAGGLLRSPVRNHVIVIDPGHGGENAGARSATGLAYEKEFTLDWARRLASLLTANGWVVFMTRTGDTDLALSNRVAFAETRKAGLFISLHFNSAAPNDSETGLETYCLTPVGMPSTMTRGFADDPAAVFPNNAFDSENLALAVRVHRALLQVNGRKDRGIRRARFLGVLRGQQRPAILVEGGYLSNPKEARLIAVPEYRQRLAEAVAKALIGESTAGDQRPDLRLQSSGTNPP